MNIIFVGGTGRCGTSITKEMIAKHPAVTSLPFEYRFIVDPDGLIDFYTSYAETWTPYLADNRRRRLRSLFWDISGSNSNGRYDGWELNNHIPNFQRHVINLMADLRKFMFTAEWVGSDNDSTICHGIPMTRQELAVPMRKFIEGVIGGLIKQAGAEFFVEDNTWNILLAREILELIPEAKIIHVYRDPRDVVASMSQQPWCPTDKVATAAWYKAIIEHWFNVRSHLPEGSILELKLEDLVESKEETVRGICEFSGLSYAPEMLDIDLSHSHGGRWKDDFSGGDKDAVDSVLHDIIEALGYA